MVADLQRNLDSLLVVAGSLLVALKKGEGGDKIQGLLSERARLLDSMGKISPKLRSELEKNVDEPGETYKKINQTVGEIMELDAECVALMENEKLGVYEKLTSLNKGMSALKGYGGKGGGAASKFLNLRK